MKILLIGETHNLQTGEVNDQLSIFVLEHVWPKTSLFPYVLTIV